MAAASSSFDFLGCGNAPIPMDEDAVLEASTMNTTVEPKRINQRTGAIVTLRCNPPEKVEQALGVILDHPRVAKAVIIDAAGTVNVLVGDQRLQAYTTVFDNPPEWTMEWLSGGGTCMSTIGGCIPQSCSYAQPLIPAGECEEMAVSTCSLTQNPLLAIPGVTEDFVKELDMSEEEQANIPFLTWYYGQLGANLFAPCLLPGRNSSVFFFVFLVVPRGGGGYIHTHPLRNTTSFIS